MSKRAVCLIWPTDINADTIQKQPSRYSWHNIDQMSGQPVAQSSWHRVVSIMRSLLMRGAEAGWKWCDVEVVWVGSAVNRDMQGRTDSDRGE